MVEKVEVDGVGVDGVEVDGVGVGVGVDGFGVLVVEADFVKKKNVLLFSIEEGLQYPFESEEKFDQRSNSR